MFDNATVAAVAAIAARLKVEPAALLAVAEVESGGKAFARVNGRNEPLIRFEGHYFDRLLSADNRDKARKAGLASPTAGAVKNPNKPADRWKLLARAEAIDRQAARESVSWGVGQVMGSHWSWLGFASVDELVDLCRRDVAGQVELMARYIEKAKLIPALRKRHWAAFARGYNEPDYKRYGYDKKIADAHARWAKRKIDVEPEEPAYEPLPPLVATKQLITRVQNRLKGLGYTEVGAVDGSKGKMTDAAILAFRKENGLALSTEIDDALLDALAVAKPRELAPEREQATPAEVAQKAPEAQANKTARDGATGLGLGAAFLIVKEYVDGVREYLSDILNGVVLGALILGAAYIAVRSQGGLSAAVKAWRTGARR